jgi:Tfp pilus assembly protein PilN
MSASLAAARKRRGVAPPEPPVVAQSPQTQQQPAGLTLPQVIALVDKRLITLEAFMKEQKDKPLQSQVQQSNSVQSLNNDILKTEIENMAEEFNNRYELLASEIQSIKDIVLKLQSYTMEVNKTLMEERVRILSDVENPSNITIDDEVLEEDA